MTNIWNEENPPLKPIDKKVSRFMQSIVGNKFDFIESDVAKQMSLYRFLLQHRSTPLEELYKSIKNINGKPMFSMNELRNIKNYVDKHKFNGFSQRVQAAQQGGDGKTYPDPRKNKFFDQMIMKGLTSVSRFFDNIIPPCVGIPPKWKETFYKILFFLHTLEGNKLLGPAISTGIDAVVLSLPVIISLVEEGAGKLIGLLPIPYASTAGDALVYACSILVILFAVMLNVSRKHFGEGFKVFLMVIPVFGDEIMTGAEQFEKGAESYMAKRDRIVDAVAEVSPTAAGIVDYWAPDVSTEVKAEPKYDLEAIKDDVIVFAKDSVQDTIGIDISTLKLDKIPTMDNLTNMAKGAVQGAVGDIGSEGLEELTKDKKSKGDEGNNDPQEAEHNAEDAEHNAEDAEHNAEDAEHNAEKVNKKVKKLKRGTGSRNVTKNAKNGGARRRSRKNQRRK
jgi:hypothetical protein